MQTDTINCNNCGAPLSLPGGANYVHCNHCGTNLVVRRDENITYTEKLEQIDERTKEIQQQLGAMAPLKVPQANLGKAGYLGLLIPIIMGCMFAALGYVAATEPIKHGAPPALAVFGYGFVAIGVIIAIGSATALIKGLLSSSDDSSNTAAGHSGFGGDDLKRQ